MVWRNTEVKPLKVSSTCPMICTYKNSILYRVSTPLEVSMGVFTHIHKAMYDQGKIFLNNMPFLESIITRLS